MTPSARELSSPLWIGRGLVALATVLLLSFPLISDDGYYQNMIILSLVFAIGASGLNIITGFAGYVSLGQGASSASAATPSACWRRSSPASRRGCGCRSRGSSPPRWR